MRRFAHEHRRVHLSQTAMIDEATGLLVRPCDTEEEIFEALNLIYIPPEGRHC
jgi:DNA polymerase/3'-5' exonuclease PolX